MNQEGEQKNEILEDTIVKISEHFDAVEIMVTWEDEAGTHMISAGRGNIYTRIGMNKHWYEQSKEKWVDRIDHSDKEERE